MNEDELTQEQLEVISEVLNAGGNVGRKVTNITQTQNTTGSNTQSSEGSSTQTSSVEYKPVSQEVFDKNKALQYLNSMPFVDAMKLAGIEKPDPKILKQAKRRQKYRANAATLAETLRVMSDMGSAFAGGNVYARDNKDVEKANADYEKEENAYTTKLNAYQKELLNGILNDRATKLNLLNNIENTFNKQTKTESENKQSSSSESSQNTTSGSTQTVEGGNRVTKDANGNYVYNYGRGGNSKSNYSIALTTKDANGVTRARNVEIKGGKEGWESYINKASNLILSNPDLVAKVAQEFGVSENSVKMILRNAKQGSNDMSAERVQYVLSCAQANQAMIDLLDANIELGSGEETSSSAPTTPTNPGDSTNLWQWN